MGGEASIGDAVGSGMGGRLTGACVVSASVGGGDMGARLLGMLLGNGVGVIETGDGAMVTGNAVVSFVGGRSTGGDGLLVIAAIGTLVGGADRVIGMLLGNFVGVMVTGDADEVPGLGVRAATLIVDEDSMLRGGTVCVEGAKLPTGVAYKGKVSN